MRRFRLEERRAEVATGPKVIDVPEPVQILFGENAPEVLEFLAFSVIKSHPQGPEEPFSSLIKQKCRVQTQAGVIGMSQQRIGLER